ncbi:alpha/beta hydrolase [Nonomuraea sp. NPDC050328]|uniref:alpha/beta hydrolase n=1 Tax=Nonomuraea sp. NPDC050328 TaxID=3364361 RepID=UPI0037BAE513
MAEHTAALAAFNRGAALAAGCRDRLDPAVRLMNGHAWVGGGAPAFGAELAGRRAALQAALSEALAALATQVVRHGGAAPVVPRLGTSVAVANPPSGAYRGIEPEAMTSLITALGTGGEALAAAGTRLAAELSGAGADPGPGSRLGQVAAWCHVQADDLRRRLSRIRQQAPGGALSGSGVAYGLFGGFAPDTAGTQALLGRLSGGDAEALRQLLAGRDPGQAGRVSAWWQTLDLPARSRAAGLPGFGLLDGLPCAVRDRANREYLAAEKARLLRERDAGVAEVARDPRLLGGWEPLNDRLRRIELIERVLRPVAGHPPQYLLAFDLTGLGRLVLSWGDPDAADITVTSVSGLSSSLDGAAGEVQRSRALWQQSSTTSGGRAVASITWLGYDAPQLDPGIFQASRSVTLDRAAALGGVALAGFMDGLRASHRPSGTARSVVVGHSYGSLTTGKAAVLRPGRLADTLVFVGSPGVGVSHVSELGMRGSQVWVGEAGTDPVAMLGRFGRDPGRPEFGAQSFPVAPGVPLASHSSYWDADSASLFNLGYIINGQCDRIAQLRPQILLPQVAPEIVLPDKQVTPRCTDSSPLLSSSPDAQ